MGACCSTPDPSPRDDAGTKDVSNHHTKNSEALREHHSHHNHSHHHHSRGSMKQYNSRLNTLSTDSGRLSTGTSPSLTANLQGYSLETPKVEMEHSVESSTP